MRYLFFAPVVITLVIVPFMIWTTMITSWTTGNSLIVVRRMAGNIEMIVPLSSLFWNLAIYDKYFRSGLKENILLYGVGKTCILQSFVNLALFGVCLSVTYMTFYHYFPVVETILGEWYKTMTQAFFLNAVAYAGSFVLQHYLYGFIAAFSYYMGFMFFNLSGKYSIFCGENLYKIDPLPMRAVNNALIYGTVLYVIGYAANRIYTRKKGGLQLLKAKIKGAQR